MNRSIRTRVREAAERLVAEQQVVWPLDVIVGLGWLAAVHEGV